MTLNIVCTCASLGLIRFIKLDHNIVLQIIALLLVILLAAFVFIKTAYEYIKSDGKTPARYTMFPMLIAYVFVSIL